MCRSLQNIGPKRDDRPSAADTRIGAFPHEVAENERWWNEVGSKRMFNRLRRLYGQDRPNQEA